MADLEFVFWFEYGSTYSYLSVMRIDALASRRHVSVQWKPFLLMPILKDFGMDDGPFANPIKQRYMWRDLERRAKLYQLPYRRPSVYPPSTLLTARVGLVAAQENWCAEFSRQVFHRHWVDDSTIGTEENLRASIGACDKNINDVLERAQSSENKEALRKQTERAKQIGIFGSPTFLVGDELFWGDDRLDDAIEYYCNQVGIPASVKP